MNKIDKIDYLKSIVKYLNLSKVCELYNKVNPEEKIDYNNLRVVINKQSISRLSEEKLDKFITFLIDYIILKVFKFKDSKETIMKGDLKNKINNTINDFNLKILEVIDEEISIK